MRRAYPAMPAAERRQETGTHDWPLRRSSRITGRTGAFALTRKGADVGQVGL